MTARSHHLTLPWAERGPSRAVAAQQGREAADIAARGTYVARSGRSVDISADVARAVAATRDVRPEDVVIPPSGKATASPRIRVVDGTSLASARAFAQEGVVPLVLNFASAKNPGGGFLSGARAQEESLARSSALYPCLLRSAMYRHHRETGDPMYTAWVVSSPAVPVFRDDVSGALLEEPYAVSFLTSPAPNAGVVLARDPGRREEVDAVMRERVARVLAVAAEEGHRHLVLGAWGCGVFRNDPAVVAEAFRAELEGARQGAFEAVTFAVLDGSEAGTFRGPFAREFG